MRKFLIALLFLFAPALHAQDSHIRVLHNRFNPLDSIEVVELRGHPYQGQFKPPAIYAQWWQEVMLCSGLTAPKADLDDVKWYYITGSHGFLVTGEPNLLAGWTSLWTREIFLSDDLLLNKGLVMHEMLHFILWENGTYGGHPKEYFTDRCHLPINQ